MVQDRTRGTAVFGDVKEGPGVVEVSFVYNAPIDESFFLANRKFRVKAIRVRPLVAGTDAGAVTAVIRKAASGTAIASGTALHSGSIDLKATINTNIVPTLSTTATDLEIAIGDVIGMDATGITTAARGLVTVLLAPR